MRAKIPVLSTTLGAALLAVLATGCSSTRPGAVRPAGFLGDYSELTPSGSGETLLYVSRPGVLADYDRFMLEPVFVYFHAESPAAAVNPEALNELAGDLRETVADELRDAGYTLVDAPGPGVLRIRAALTDVDAQRPAANVAAKVAGAATTGLAIAVPTVDIGRASIEAEMLDGRTGQRVVAFVDSKKGRRFRGVVAAAQKWGHAHAAFREWAKQLRERLDASRGSR